MLSILWNGILHFCDQHLFAKSKNDHGGLRWRNEQAAILFGGQSWMGIWNKIRVQGSPVQHLQWYPHGSLILVGVSDTLSDSIQCLNFAKKWFIQYSIQYRFTQDSIQNIIQFKKNSADSIQKIIQFNSQGLFDTGRIGKVPKKCPKSVQNRQKGDFYQKWKISIQNMIHSFLSR